MSDTDATLRLEVLAALAAARPEIGLATLARHPEAGLCGRLPRRVPSLRELLWRELAEDERRAGVPPRDSAAAECAAEYVLRRRSCRDLERFRRDSARLPQPWLWLALQGAGTVEQVCFQLGVRVALAAVAAVPRADQREWLRPLGAAAVALLFELSRSGAAPAADAVRAEVWRAAVEGEANAGGARRVARLGRRLLAALYAGAAERERAAAESLGRTNVFRRLATEAALPLPRPEDRAFALALVAAVKDELDRRRGARAAEERA